MSVKRIRYAHSYFTEFSCVYGTGVEELEALLHCQGAHQLGKRDHRLDGGRTHPALSAVTLKGIFKSCKNCQRKTPMDKKHIPAQF
jgi:hypothetical protein